MFNCCRAGHLSLPRMLMCRFPAQSGLRIWSARSKVGKRAELQVQHSKEHIRHGRVQIHSLGHILKRPLFRRESLKAMPTLLRRPLKIDARLLNRSEIPLAGWFCRSFLRVYLVQFTRSLGVSSSFVQPVSLLRRTRTKSDRRIHTLCRFCLAGWGRSQLRRSPMGFFNSLLNYCVATSGMRDFSQIHPLSIGSFVTYL